MSPKLTENQKAKDVGCSNSTIKRYRIDSFLDSPYSVSQGGLDPKGSMLNSKGLEETPKANNSKQSTKRVGDKNERNRADSDKILRNDL